MVAFICWKCKLFQAFYLFHLHHFWYHCVLFQSTVHPEPESQIKTLMVNKNKRQTMNSFQSQLGIVPLQLRALNTETEDFQKKKNTSNLHDKNKACFFFNGFVSCSHLIPKTLQDLPEITSAGAESMKGFSVPCHPMSYTKICLPTITSSP